MNKPNLFIVGAAKAGTTSVYNYLKAHPDIIMSSIKEPNFFGSDIRWENFEPKYKKETALNFKNYFSRIPLQEKHIAFVDKEEYYLKLFEGNTEVRYWGEASTSYLFSTNAAGEIQKYNPDAKIIIILREPVDRTLSHYFMDLSGNSQNETNILRGLKKDYAHNQKGWGVSHLYLELSLYYEQVKRYIDIFPKEQIHFLYYTDLKNDTSKAVQELFDFLNLEITDLPESSKRYNETLIPRYKVVKTLRKLKAILPKSVVSYLKDKMSFLFKVRKDYEIPAEAIDFIYDMTIEDWNKTKSCIKS